MEKNARKETVFLPTVVRHRSAVPLSYLDLGKKDSPPHADLGLVQRSFTTSSAQKNCDKEKKGWKAAEQALERWKRKEERQQ